MESKKIQAGATLVARPSLLTDIFSRSVVLLAEHSHEETIGFVLNKISDFQINELIPEIHKNFSVFEGGPVERGSLFYIHNSPHLIRNSMPIYKNLYWGGNFNDIILNINNGMLSEINFRFFIGYSGWGSHQLERELKMNDWFLGEDGPSFLDLPYKDLWKIEMKKMGGENLLWINMPEDPTLN